MRWQQAFNINMNPFLFIFLFRFFKSFCSYFILFYYIYFVLFFLPCIGITFLFICLTFLSYLNGKSFILCWCLDILRFLQNIVMECNVIVVMKNHKYDNDDDCDLNKNNWILSHFVLFFVVIFTINHALK